MIKIYEKVNGYDESIKQEVPNLVPYLINDNKKHSTMIVCPGGAYSFLADHEGAPIALWLNSIGINAFVLNYRVSPYKYLCPLEDLKRAIRYVRYNCKKYNTSEDKIGVLGFSAGGHLAGSACVHFDACSANPNDKIDKLSSRPDISVLCYPVISLTEYVHEGSKENLLGKNPSKELVEFNSLEKQVHENTPPAFIWSTAPDDSVPMENSLLYAKALKEKNVPFELHVFPEGHHGLGLKNEYPYVQRWADLCKDWLLHMNFIL